MSELNDETFDAAVQEGTVLVDFWAPWCGPCRMLLPIIDEITSEYEGKLKVVKFNVDDNSVIPNKFNIMGVPCLMIFKDGKMTAQRTGLASKTIIKTWIDSNI